jgi:prepilin-type N-terminal cleavage/methylation domain-containing protein
MKNIYKQKRQQGFTIIEVLIVLAIAALILLIVFLAVPALQRNSRNNSRNNDAARVAALVNDYVANHAGTLPTGVCYTAPAGGCPTTQLDISSEQFAIMDKQSTAPASPAIVNGTAFPTNSNTTLNINEKANCNQATNTMSGGSSRQFAISYHIESSSDGGGTTTSTQKCISG